MPKAAQTGHTAAQSRQIIDRADTLTLKNIRVFMPAALLTVFLPNALRIAAGALWGPDLGLAAGALALLLQPIFTLGFSALCLKAWRGRPFSLRELLAFCTRRAWPRAMAFCLPYGLIAVLPPLAAYALPRVFEGLPAGPAAYLGAAANLALALLSGWLLVRLLPAPYLYILAPEAGAGAPLKAGFGLTRGRLGGLLRFYLRVLLRALPLITIALLAAAAAFALGLPGMLAALPGLIASLARALVVPLFALSGLGYIDGWLPTNSQTRKKRKLDPPPGNP